MNMKNSAKKGDPAKSVFHDWTKIHPSQDQPIKPIQQQDPTEDTTTPAAPTEVEGPPRSRLRSKMKQQHTSHKQEQPERNPTPTDPPECNPAEIEVNSIDIIPKSYSWMRLTKFLMQEKPLMTQLQSAYPNKFLNQFIYIFFSTNFVPFHLKETTQSITYIVRISFCHIFYYHKISMATPKATNDHFLRKTRNSSERNLFIPIAVRTADLTKL